MIGTISEIARAVGGRLVGEGDTRATGVCFDSRRLVPGDLFFALVAERDGHDFVGEAARAGASAVVVSREVASPVSSIVVADTLEALGRLGSHNRARRGARVVGLTGSCGKTTTRELVAAVLSAGGTVHQSRGNLNNHIGVPVTLAGLDDSHAFCVVEMGTNHHGEIASLTRMADPDVGLVTCVAEAHTEFLGDLDGVARAKGELFATMRRDAVAVVNLDDPNVASMPLTPGTRVSYGTARADVTLRRTRQLDEGGQEIALTVQGREVGARMQLGGAHNALNAAGAVAVALACGVDVEAAAKRLASVPPVAGRGATRAGRRLLVIDDAYNANPASMKAGLSMLVARSAGRRTVAVLGDMFELGERSGEMHGSVGREAAVLGVDLVVAVGERALDVRLGASRGGASDEQLVCFETTGAAVDGLGALVREGDLVLVKGSRAMKMERVVEFLLYW